MLLKGIIMIIVGIVGMVLTIIWIVISIGKSNESSSVISNNTEDNSYTSDIFNIATANQVVLDNNIKPLEPNIGRKESESTVLLDGYVYDKEIEETVLLKEENKDLKERPKS